MLKPPCTILLVDDDLSWQKIYQRILTGVGNSVEIASTKDEAMQRIEQRTFDIVIVDLRLVDNDETDMGGIQVIERLRNLTKPTKVIVKSGYLTEEVRNRLRELNVDGILDKSTTNKELVEMIAKLRQ